MVEDDAAIRDGLAITVADEYRVTFTTCQAGALAALEDTRFDMALVDLRLPITPEGIAAGPEAGIEILRTIRRRRVTQGETRRALPVVVMTAQLDAPSLIASLFSDYGANDFVAKPFGKDQLLDKLRRALLGQGAVAPAGELATAELRLAFDDERRQVHVESLPFDGTLYTLLDALRSQYLEDLDARRASDAYTFVSSQTLVRLFGVTADTLRRRVLRARKQLHQAIEDELHRATSDQDVIETEQWKGYRLNPRLVRVVDLSELPAQDDSTPPPPARRRP